MEKGDILVLLVKEEWFCVDVSLSFALAQDAPGKCCLCVPARDLFVCFCLARAIISQQFVVWVKNLFDFLQASVLKHVHAGRVPMPMCAWDTKEEILSGSQLLRRHTLMF